MKCEGNFRALSAEESRPAHLRETCKCNVDFCVSSAVDKHEMICVFFICCVHTVFTLLRVERSWRRKTSQPSSSRKHLLSKKGIYLRVWIFFFCVYAHFFVLKSFLCCFDPQYHIFKLLSDGKPAQSKRLLTEEPQSDRTLGSDHQQEGNGWSNLLDLSSVCSLSVLLLQFVFVMLQAVCYWTYCCNNRWIRALWVCVTCCPSVLPLFQTSCRSTATSARKYQGTPLCPKCPETWQIYWKHWLPLHTTVCFGISLAHFHGINH